MKPSKGVLLKLAYFLFAATLACIVFPLIRMRVNASRLLNIQQISFESGRWLSVSSSELGEPNSRAAMKASVLSRFNSNQNLVEVLSELGCPDSVEPSPSTNSNHNTITNSKTPKLEVWYEYAEYYKNSGQSFIVFDIDSQGHVQSVRDVTQ